MNQFQSKHPGAFNTGKAIFELAQGCYAFEAIVQMALNAPGGALVPPINPSSVLSFPREDGSKQTHNSAYYLTLGKGHAFVAPRIRQSWIACALITAGDLLERHGCFDHGTELELI
jgi:hypothetical protein